MSLTIAKDVILTANTTTQQWDPLPCIMGEPGKDGEDAYHIWLKDNQKQESEATKQEWYASLRNGGAPGASRIVQQGSQFIVYTPKTASTIVEPPAYDTEFQEWDRSAQTGYDTYVFSTGGATFRNIGTNATASSDMHVHAFMMAQGRETTTGAEVSQVDTITGAGYDPRGILCFGNRTTAPNLSTTAKGRLGQIYPPIIYAGYYQTDRINSTQKPEGSSYTFKDIYGTQRDVGIIELGAYEGNLYIGGRSGNDTGSGDSHCNLGQTVLVAGAASFTGRTYKIGTSANASGYATTAKGGLEVGTDNTLNAIMIQRKKVGNDKKWGGAWSSFANIDSGHIAFYEWQIPITKLKTNYAQPYQVVDNFSATVSSPGGALGGGQAKFKTAPIIQYSIDNWYTTREPQSFDDIFSLYNVKYDVQTNKLSATLYEKKNPKDYFSSLSNTTKDYFTIQFLLISRDCM